MHSHHPQTLQWNGDVGGYLTIIDQTALPLDLTTVDCRDLESVVHAIRVLQVRGAPAIGCAAAYGIALAALNLKEANTENFLQGMESAFNILSHSRPTAINLFWALERMRLKMETAAESSPNDIATVLLTEAHNIATEDIQTNRSLGHLGATLLPDSARVLTHCNAGALATAGYGTALGVIRAAVESGKKISVIADETRPFLQGARLTAWEMVQENIPVTLIADNMAGHLMHCGDIDAIIVGTDRVASNGDVANKIGTYMVAVLAKRHNIPFYVACPLSTIDRSINNGSEIPIEERPSEEVTGYQNHQWAAEGVNVRNPAFDITPAELVTALITEKGIVSHPNKERICKLF